MAEHDRLEHDEKTRGQIAALVEGERRMLAQRKQQRGDCDCKDGMFPNPSRRRMLFGAGSALAAAAAGSIGPAAAEDQKRRASAGATWRDVPDEPTKEQGTPISADGGYGTRSQFETEIRLRAGTPTTLSAWTMSPLE